MAECFDSTQLSSGPFVQRFEAILAETCGARHAVATNNGTSALHLAYLAAGIGPLDEVIVPVCTFIATSNAVLYCGARPVFVDSDATWCADPDAIVDAVTPLTKAVVPVHLYGLPCDMDPILNLESEGIKVIVDAAEAIGAVERGKVVGSTGFATTLSLFGNKILTCGEGGAVLTNSDEAATHMRLLRGQGQGPNRYEHVAVGFNYRLTDLQASVGVGQVEKLNEHLYHRRRVRALYRQYLPDGYLPQPEPPGRNSAHWMVAVQAPSALVKDRAVALCTSRQIETRPVFPPLHLQPCYSHLGYKAGQFPVAERLHRHGIVLPTHACITEDDVVRVCTALEEAL